METKQLELTPAEVRTWQDFLAALRMGRWEWGDHYLRCAGQFCSVGAMADFAGVKWQYQGELGGGAPYFHYRPKDQAKLGLTFGDVYRDVWDQIEKAALEEGAYRAPVELQDGMLSADLERLYADTGALTLEWLHDESSWSWDGMAWAIESQLDWSTGGAYGDACSWERPCSV